LHETYAGHEEVKGGSDRSFGLTVGGILAAIGLYRLLLGSGVGAITLLLLAVGAALVLGGLVAPAALAPLNRAWTRLGLVLFKIVNPVVMFLIWATTVVPTGLVMRLRGRDLLRLERSSAAASYWLERPRGEPDPKSMINQF
jgi:hypothetical protein